MLHWLYHPVYPTWLRVREGSAGITRVRWHLVVQRMLPHTAGTGLMPELPALSPSSVPSPRDCLRTRLPPPISAEKRISACSDGHHLGTPSRGHPRPKLTPCSTCWREFAAPWGCLPSVSPVAFLETVKSLRRRQNSWQWQDSAPLFIREKSKLVTLCTE